MVMDRCGQKEGGMPLPTWEWDGVMCRGELEVSQEDKPPYIHCSRPLALPDVLTIPTTPISPPAFSS